MDGAYFGTTFPHLLLMTYPSMKPAKQQEVYVPRVFGFKLHASNVAAQPAAIAAAAAASSAMQTSGSARHATSQVSLSWLHQLAPAASNSMGVLSCCRPRHARQSFAVAIRGSLLRSSAHGWAELASCSVHPDRHCHQCCIYPCTVCTDVIIHSV